MKFLFPFVLAAALLLPGCNQQDLASMQEASQVATDETNQLRSDYEQLKVEYHAMIDAGQGNTEAAAAMLARLERMNEEIQLGVATVNQINDDIQAAESGWDIAESIGVAAAGFIPGAGIMLPFIRMFRRRFHGTVDAITAGGGPKDPAATSRAMGEALGNVVRNRRRARGDLVDRSNGS